MHRFHLSLGSNLEPEKHLCAALRDLRARFGGLRISSVYESAAVGFDGPPFWNLAADVHADVDAAALNIWLHDLEAREGRVRGGARYDDRTLDVDIVAVDGVAMDRAELQHAFVLAPLAWINKRPGVTLGGVLRNWGLVFIGNFAGALTVAFMMAFVTTFGFTQGPDKVGAVIGNIGEGRTLGYAAHGAAGMATLFIRGMLCNWMVSTGVVGAMVSTSVSGKVIAMWMPIMLFFYMVFEHSVVNMFLFPAGLMLHAPFSVMDYFIWNEIPTALGNLVGGLTFTGLTLYATHVKTAPARELRTVSPRAA